VKPRACDVTEIRGPYYSVIGPRYLKDVLDTMGEHVDALKSAVGSFTLMPETALRELIDIVHAHDVHVSTRTSRARLAPDGAACLSKPRSKGGLREAARQFDAARRGCKPQRDSAEAITAPRSIGSRRPEVRRSRAGKNRSPARVCHLTGD
jgi:(2R)-phospho-3-sulfolactate synthase (ComA)